MYDYLKYKALLKISQVQTNKINVFPSYAKHIPTGPAITGFLGRAHEGFSQFEEPEISARVILAWEHFCTCTVWRCGCSARLTQEHFHKGIFRHRFQNIHIALQGAKIFMYRNVQMPKYPVPKCLRVKTFLC